MPNSPVSQIISTEVDRLQSKKQSLDHAVDGQRRLVQFNENYRKRYSKYTQIALIVVLAIAIFLAISLIPKYLPFIPSTIVDILVIILVVVIFFVLLSYYNDIKSRNPMNYDEIDIPPVLDGSNNNQNTNTLNTILAQNAESGSLTDMLGTTGNVCVGSQCCPTKWNANANQCGFTTITDAYNTESYTSDNALKNTLSKPYNQNHISGDLSSVDSNSVFTVDLNAPTLTFSAYV